MSTSTAALQALTKIAAMDPEGVRADDLGRAAGIARAALAAAPAAQDAPAGLPLEQEPKYTVNGSAIVNRHSGEAIPADEPVFIFRARDALGVAALRAYLALIGDREPASAHAEAVAGRIADFQRFAAAHPERMKWPDTAATPAAHPVAGQVHAATVPNGWKLVPEKLTDAMVKAAADAWLDCGSRLMLNKAAAAVRAALAAAPTAPQAPALVPLTEHHKLDNHRQVFFYEQDFYVLSNFSSFALHWKGLDFPTSEHAYHWEKFNMRGEQQAECRNRIHGARSAHDAFKVAAELKPFRRAAWDELKVGIMRDILRTKANQHEYVRRKLLATGDRELVEDSWRDDYWGWGPNRDGQNLLGKLWMEVRAGLRGITPAGTTPKEQQ